MFQIHIHESDACWVTHSPTLGENAHLVDIVFSTREAFSPKVGKWVTLCEMTLI